MKKTVFALSALGLAAGCVLPEGVTEADLAAWDAAVATIGCDLVDESDYAPVQLQTGIPRQKLIEISQYKVNNKQAVGLSNGGVRSVTGACTPAAAPAAEQVAQAAPAG